MQLLLSHRHQLIAFIAKQLVNPSDVEDVFQKTSIVLWKKFSRFKKDSRFIAWACGVAFNEVRNHIRTQGRDLLRFTPELLDILATEAEEENVLSQTRMDALNECMKKLTDAQRRLARQCYAGENSITAIAADGNVSRGAL